MGQTQLTQFRYKSDRTDRRRGMDQTEQVQFSHGPDKAARQILGSKISGPYAFKILGP